MFSEDRLAGYPLRQSLLAGAKGLQIFANRGVVDWMSRPDRYLVLCEGRGGRIYAADECALEEAQQMVRDAHGAKVVMRKPEIHTYVDLDLDALVEPVMFLRIKSPHAYAKDILAELSGREARILEKDMQRYELIVRAEGRLANLMGLTRKIGSLACGSAAVWTWLHRYERAMAAPSPGVETRDPTSCTNGSP
ncbi:hypothetical protein [Variovorax sp. PBL-E5]|uniref:hypothetical protein n=1 Tax=Variovorax sp. PBL-E5 TaxID=434014 RepID=UPI0013178BA6|nr:hypothetical protein [Variovorax sp. PBL-E5]VTU23167.1 elongation factor G [Variovorax sp. PBL-E5]